jgi:hypothetical protein
MARSVRPDHISIIYGRNRQSCSFLQSTGREHSSSECKILMQITDLFYSFEHLYYTPVN